MKSNTVSRNVKSAEEAITCGECRYFARHINHVCLGRCCANPPVIVPHLVGSEETDPEYDPEVFDDRIACRFFEKRGA